jgi:hypothetical protein
MENYFFVNSRILGDACGVYRCMLNAYNAGEARKLEGERIEGELQEMRLDAKSKRVANIS